MGQLLRASGVTLLVPVGLLASVALAATVGNGGTLGSVGQLVGGPDIPRANASASEVDLGSVSSSTAAGTSATSLPTVPVATDRSVRRSTGSTTAQRPKTSSRPTRAAQPTTSTKPQTSQSTGTKKLAPTTQTAPTPPPATTTETPPPPPAQETNPVRQLGKTVQGVVEPLPIVGPTTSDAVGTVIDLLAPPGS